MNETKLPEQNAFAILDQLVQSMAKTKINNYNFATIQTKAIKKARAGLTEWGYRGDQASSLISDALDMAAIIRNAEEHQAHVASREWKARQ